MPEHTKEPWGVRHFTGDHGRATIEQYRTDLTEPFHPIANICEMYGSPGGQGRGVSDANAERIVACVNACKGLNPEAIPDLLVAVTAAANRLEHSSPPHWVVMKHLKAAIAKAKG
ncbi:MAG: hypothetical protein GY841_18590 [FCB group bacterium]|nr:hypothetical protein [FCB group bacterium]